MEVLARGNQFAGKYDWGSLHVVFRKKASRRARGLGMDNAQVESAIPLVADITGNTVLIETPHLGGSRNFVF